MGMKTKTGQKCHNCGKVFWASVINYDRGIAVCTCEYCKNTQPLIFTREYVLDENGIAIGELDREENIAQ